MSDAEVALAWQMKAAVFPEPTPEFRFDKIRRWRFDFAWPVFGVAVEVEGGSWTGGRHSTGAGFEKDAEKYNEATLAGWKVLRVTPNMINDGRALAFIERALYGEKAT